MYNGAAFRQFFVVLSIYCGRQHEAGMPEAVALLISNQFFGPSIPQHIIFFCMVSQAIKSSFKIQMKWQFMKLVTRFHNPTWLTLLWRLIDFCNWSFNMSFKSFLKVSAAIPTAISMMKIAANRTANCNILDVSVYLRLKCEILTSINRFGDSFIAP